MTNDTPSIVKTIRPVIRRLPLAWLQRVGRLLGRTAFWIDRRHRRIVRRNLRFAYPDWARAQVRDHSRLVFENIGVTFCEIIRMLCLSRREMISMVEMSGGHHLANAIQTHRAAIFVSAHLGNWEMLPVFANCYFDHQFVFVARPLQLKGADTLIRWLRTRFGNILVDKDKAMAKMNRALKDGNSVGLLIDQEARRSQGIEVDFFGKTIHATPAAAMLALRNRCPVVPAVCVRTQTGRLQVVVSPPMTLRRSGDLRADLVHNTQLMIRAVEQAIRRHSDQWLWVHKRWKRHYPHLYREELLRRQQRRLKKRARKNRVGAN